MGVEYLRCLIFDLIFFENILSKCDGDRKHILKLYRNNIHKIHFSQVLSLSNHLYIFVILENMILISPIKEIFSPLETKVCLIKSQTCDNDNYRTVVGCGGSSSSASFSQ